MQWRRAGAAALLAGGAIAVARSFLARHHSRRRPSARSALPAGLQARVSQALFACRICCCVPAATAAVVSPAMHGTEGRATAAGHRCAALAAACLRCYEDRAVAAAEPSSTLGDPGAAAGDVLTALMAVAVTAAWGVLATADMVGSGCIEALAARLRMSPVDHAKRRRRMTEGAFRSRRSCSAECRARP